MEIKKLTKSAIKYIIAIIIIIVFSFPFFYMVIISTQKVIWILQTPPSLRFDLSTIIETYNDVIFWRSGGFLYGVRNSAIVVTISVLFALVLGVTTAYGLTRYKLRKNRDIAFFILSNRFMPPIVVAYPVFIMISAIHLQDTYIGLAIPYIGMNLPFVVWMMSAFFREIPTEIDDAAMIDGCSRFEALWRIIIPMTLPGLAATAIFCAIFTWNELLLALHIVSTTSGATVTVMAAGSMSVERPMDWNIISAEGVFIMLPILIMAFLVQKHLVRGLTLGALKG